MYFALAVDNSFGKPTCLEYLQLPHYSEKLVFSKQDLCLQSRNIGVLWII